MYNHNHHQQDHHQSLIKGGVSQWMNNRLRVAPIAIHCQPLEMMPKIFKLKTNWHILNIDQTNWHISFINILNMQETLTYCQQLPLF